MTISQQFDTFSPTETIKAGQRLASSLNAGDLLALSGELGSGKTCLVQGIARGLGITRNVTSPTFTLIHEYEGGRLPLYHIDLYRLDSTEQALAIGIEEYLTCDGITVIEWAEKVESLLPERTIRIFLEAVTETTRRIQIR